MYLTITPDLGAAMSTVTLSVSILAKISSSLTKSPGSNRKLLKLILKYCGHYLRIPTLDELFNGSLGDGVPHAWHLDCLGYYIKTKIRNESLKL